jgi:NAD(P)-dependent dehydrogenase (short-subunit alcohol dehydrogenase family)
VGQLDGKRILITGAGSGIGRAAARLIRERGAHVVLLGRNADALRETLPDVEHLTADHADDAAVAAALDRCGALDGLFLNAGQFVAGTVESTPVADFDRMVDANLRGPWLVCHHAARRLRDGASIVLTGSNIGIRAIPNAAAYAVAKAALHMLARVLAAEWGARGIRCNAIAPGPVDTEMLRSRFDDPEAALSALARVNPLARVGHAEDVALLACHLLSDESRWTTGTVIPCDGGATGVFQ